MKQDVTIAKNYLDEKQIRQLERAVTGYFDVRGLLIFNKKQHIESDFDRLVKKTQNSAT